MKFEEGLQRANPLRISDRYLFGACFVLTMSWMSMRVSEGISLCPFCMDRSLGVWTYHGCLSKPVGFASWVWPPRGLLSEALFLFRNAFLHYLWNPKRTTARMCNQEVDGLMYHASWIAMMNVGLKCIIRVFNLCSTLCKFCVSVLTRLKWQIMSQHFCISRLSCMWIFNVEVSWKIL